MQTCKKKVRSDLNGQCEANREASWSNKRGESDQRVSVKKTKKVWAD